VEIGVLTVKNNEHNVMCSVGDNGRINREFPRVRTGQSPVTGNPALSSHLEGTGSRP
jgi:hypothetical protein